MSQVVIFFLVYTLSYPNGTLKAGGMDAYANQAACEQGKIQYGLDVSQALEAEGENGVAELHCIEHRAVPGTPI